MAPSTATTCRARANGRRSHLLLSVRALVAFTTAIAFFALPVHCQSEKRLSSVQQQQQQHQYYDSEELTSGGGGDVIKSKIRQDTYSQDPSSVQQYEKHLQHGKQSDAVGSASTVYGEQYGDGSVLMQQNHPLLDEEAQESISSGSINNHRIPQYTRGGSPVSADVVEGKNVGNRAVGNNYHHPGNPSPATGGYAVDSAYGPHYSSQDLVQDQSYQLEFKYHDYDKMTKFLRTTSSRYPNLTALYSIGKSVQGTFTYVTL